MVAQQSGSSRPLTDRSWVRVPPRPPECISSLNVLSIHNLKNIQKQWPVGQTVKTSPFHGGDRSSILLRVTICDSSSVGQSTAPLAEIVGSSPTESLARDFIDTYSSANQIEGW